MKSKRVKESSWDRAGVGWYEPIHDKHNKLKWNIKLDKNGDGIIVEKQEHAQIISMLVRIMEKIGMRETLNYFDNEEHQQKDDRIFHDHIKSHFEKEHPDWKVICKICGKSYDEIVSEGLNEK